MNNKKRSGKFPLFALCRDKNLLLCKIGILIIFVIELFIMYIIQNNFCSARWQGIGVILLVLSLSLAAMPLSVFSRKIKGGRK